MAWTPKWIRNYVLSSRVLHTRTVLLIAPVTSDVTQRLYHYVIHKLTALCDNLDLTSFCHWSDVPRETTPGVITVKVHFMWIKWDHLLFEAFLRKKVLLLVESSIFYAKSRAWTVLRPRLGNLRRRKKKKTRRVNSPPIDLLVSCVHQFCHWCWRRSPGHPTPVERGEGR